MIPNKVVTAKSSSCLSMFAYSWGDEMHDVLYFCIDMPTSSVNVNSVVQRKFLWILRLTVSVGVCAVSVPPPQMYEFFKFLPFNI
jgi:hypothetical protein